MPLTGHILDSRSSASVTRAAALVFCLMLPLPLLATSPYMLGAILFVFGACNGVMDVSMNAHGVAVERTLSKPIMSSLHGGWSVGGFVSAAFVVSPARRASTRASRASPSESSCGSRRSGSPASSGARRRTPRAAAGSRCRRGRCC